MKTYFPNINIKTIVIYFLRKLPALIIDKLPSVRMCVCVCDILMFIYLLQMSSISTHFY